MKTCWTMLPDQKYLFDMCSAVSAGVCPVDLSLRNPGLINQSRCLTMANRILCLYVATVNSSDELKALVSFIVTVYIPMWFEIKTALRCSTRLQYNPEITLPHRRPEENLSILLSNGTLSLAIQKTNMPTVSDAHRQAIRTRAMRRIIKTRGL